MVIRNALPRRVVLMPDPLGVYLDVTASEYMRFFARAYGLSKQVGEARIAHAVDRLGLAPWLDHEVEALSAGWQRRLALTRVLIADAPIVLLDEPAAGLDVSGRRDLLRLVRGFASEGRAVLVTSHILPELEELADRFGIIRSGQWLSVREGQPFFTRSELRAGFTEGFYRLECSEPVVACASLGVERAQLEPDGERIRLVASSRDDAASLVEQLMRAGAQDLPSRSRWAKSRRRHLGCLGRQIPPMNNPVLWIELRIRIRERKLWIVTCLYLLCLFVISAISISTAAQTGTDNNPAMTGMAIYGYGVFSLVGLLVILGPLASAGAISQEREQRTLPALLNTPMSPSTIVAGKLIAAWAFVLWLALLSLPFLALGGNLGRS